MRTRANSIKSYLLIVSPYFPRFKLPNQTTFYKDEFPHLRYNPSEQEVQSTNCPGQNNGNNPCVYVEL